MRLSFLSLLILQLFICYTTNADENILFFETNIRPILAEKCYSCHSSTLNEPKGGLSLDHKEAWMKGGDSGQVIIPKNADDSLLLQALNHSDISMPPDEKLSDQVINNFKIWINNGAIDPRDQPQSILDMKDDLWSLQPLIENNASSIDSLIQSKITTKQLTNSNNANDYVLIRRLYFDLIGVPPTVEEITSYVSDSSSDKYTKLVDRLLDDKRFGEKWARYWLDIARYGESTGKDQNVLYPYAWRYRDYIIDCFNSNKPYNIFIKEQIAGDLIPAKSIQEYNNHLIAVGFLSIGTKSLNIGPKEYLAETIDEQIDVISRGFLGITLSCARCHDHKFDPFSQKDYYSMYGILSNCQTKDGVYRGNNNIGYEGDYDYLINDDLRKYFDTNRHDLIELFGDINNKFQRLRTIHVYNPNLNENDKKQAIKEAEKVEKELSEAIAKIPDDENKILLLKILTDSPLEPVMSLRDNKSITEKTKVHIRGNVNSLGEETIKNVPQIFHNDSPETNPSVSKSSGRIELANWIADKNNPLTYRVFCNRVWNYLFGRGLVESFDNFGNLGGEPSNPELLDYLANKFINSNFNIKFIIKDIVTSNAYKQSTEFDQQNYEKDSDNIYFWRMNTKPLIADNIRDSFLSLVGELTPTHPDNTNLMTGNTKRKITGEISKEIFNAKYRSIYLPLPRDHAIEFLDIFDRPDNNLLNADRNETIVTTQALYMMNNNVVIGYCEKIAKQIIDSLKNKPIKDKIEYGYLKCLSRPPSQQELTIMEEYFKSAEKEDVAMVGFIQILVSTLEFRSVP